MSDIRFTSFPLTSPPPDFVPAIIEAFRTHESDISTVKLTKGLKSDEVLAVVANELDALGFELERGKTKDGRIERPVFYGENGVPALQYQVDGFHPGWRCGLEVEAGRAWLGGAVYRDLIQAMVMVNIDHLVLAVSNSYKYKSSGRDVTSPDYDHATDVARALFGHQRVQIPYGLTVLGY